MGWKAQGEVVQHAIIVPVELDKKACAYGRGVRTVPEKEQEKGGRQRKEFAVVESALDNRR